MIIYTVKPGDNLNSIAEAYGTLPQSLEEINGLPNPNNLVVGQTIVIPSETPDILGDISVNGYCYPYIDRTILYSALPYLSYLTIFTYGFMEAGELIVPEDDELIQTAKNYGASPILLISTLTEEGTFSNELASRILNDIPAQDILIQNLADTVRTKGYSGVDVDFEFVSPNDKNAFVNFAAKLKDTLNSEGYTLFISLAPKTSAEQPGLLYEAHDYRQLGENADIALLMTYEWGYTYGPPLPVAPIDKVREVVEYAKTEIPADKIMMGIPNYAYDWTLPFIRGESKAKSIGNTEAVEIAALYRAEILFDEAAQTPYFYYTDEEGFRHVVYFEDARSIYAKLLLAFQSGLHGISVWNIMRSFPQLWLIITENFNIRK